jgi:hypothetical protein
MAIQGASPELIAAIPSDREVHTRQPCPCEGIGIATSKTSAARNGLQAFEGQTLGVLYAGQIEPADENRHLLAITTGQGHNGVDGNPLGVHGLPREVSSRDGPEYEQRINATLTVVQNR